MTPLRFMKEWLAISRTKNNSERGITLIETLATLVILGVVGVILSNILVDGLHISNKQKAKMTVQQQANYLLVLWREFHESGDPYEIILNEEKTQVTFNRYDQLDSTKLTESEIISSDAYFFDIFIDKSETPITTQQINTKVTKSIHIKIVLSQQSNESTLYKIETILSRL